MRTREKEELCLQPKTGNSKPRRTSSSKSSQKLRQSQKVYLGVKVKTVREKLAQQRCKLSTQPVKLNQSWKKHIEQRRKQEKEYTTLTLTPLRNVTPLSAHHHYYHDTCDFISQSLPFYGGTGTQVSNDMMAPNKDTSVDVENSLENIGNIFKSANIVTTDNKWLSTLDMDDSALKFKTFNASSFITNAGGHQNTHHAQTSTSSSAPSVVMDSWNLHHGGSNVMTMMMEGGGVDHNGVEKWANYHHHQFSRTSSLDHVVTSHQSLYNPSSVVMTDKI